jgi:hypothetical protein
MNDVMMMVVGQTCTMIMQGWLVLTPTCTMMMGLGHIPVDLSNLAQTYVHDVGGWSSHLSLFKLVGCLRGCVDLYNKLCESMYVARSRRCDYLTRVLIRMRGLAWLSDFP